MRVAHGVEPRLQVFYDADCDFCARTARLLRTLDRRERLELIPLQGAGERLTDAPSTDRLHDRMHVRDAEGAWTVGGAAWLRIADVVPALQPFAIVARLPFVRPFVEPVYTIIARNRHRISRLLGHEACTVRGSHP